MKYQQGYSFENFLIVIGYIVFIEFGIGGTLGTPSRPVDRTDVDFVRVHAHRTGAYPGFCLVHVQSDDWRRGLLTVLTLCLPQCTSQRNWMPKRAKDPLFRASQAPNRLKAI
eukprot:2930942-Pyramimonas_sp.AAC.1